MDLQVRECACIARGTFNVYIFQPAWVSKLIKLPKGEELTMRGDLSRPGVQLQASSLQVTWTVRPDAVIVATPEWGVDCGRQVAGVLAALPLTPMQAVGNNFVFFAPIKSLGSYIFSPWIKYFGDVPGAAESRVGGSVERDGRRFNVSLVVSGDELVVAVNVHRDVTESKACVEAAEAFPEDGGAAIDLVSELFGLKVVTNVL